ncbi:MAG TPA: AMP-binding protein [Burkholderiaceae bacterium]|nr:AMP-binding protein [Burkholderiaceae bacterium]
MLGPNDLYTLVAVLGIVRSASVWLPVNARNSLAENIHILKNGDCEFLFLHSAHASDMQALKASLPRLKQVVCIDAELDDAPSLISWAAQQDSARPAIEQSPDDVVAIRGTGGTTGMPKGVLVTHRVYQAMIANFLANMPLSRPPVQTIPIWADMIMGHWSTSSTRPPPCPPTNCVARSTLSVWSWFKAMGKQKPHSFARA